MDNMNQIISQIRKELKASCDPVYKQGEIRFFREKIKTYGVRSSVSKEIYKRYFDKIKNLEKKEIFALCEELMKSGYIQEVGCASKWTFKLNKRYEEKDFKIFENWVKKYITNWANCDDFSTHTIGSFIFQFPEFVPAVKEWTKSKNRWVKRASAVSFIYPVRKGRYLKDVFEISDALLQDPDDMVQKGYGWALKEASNVFPEQVFNYVMKNKNKMPRLALRYAIEKYPQNLRQKAMEK